ncbi:MAG: phage tail protein [Thermonemataceae bacterium]
MGFDPFNPLGIKPKPMPGFSFTVSLIDPKAMQEMLEKAGNVIDDPKKAINDVGGAVKGGYNKAKGAITGLFSGSEEGAEGEGEGFSAEKMAQDINYGTITSGIQGATKATAYFMPEGGFNSISGLKMTLDIGKGENDKETIRKIKTSKELTLERDMLPTPSLMTTWFIDTLKTKNPSDMNAVIKEQEYKKISEKDQDLKRDPQVRARALVIMLKNYKNHPLMAWLVFEVRPHSYEVSGFNSKENGLIKEKFVYTYTHFEMLPIGVTSYGF